MSFIQIVFLSLKAIFIAFGYLLSLSLAAPNLSIPFNILCVSVSRKDAAHIRFGVSGFHWSVATIQSGAVRTRHMSVEDIGMACRTELQT